MCNVSWKQLKFCQCGQRHCRIIVRQILGRLKRLMHTNKQYVSIPSSRQKGLASQAMYNVHSSWVSQWP